MRRILIDALTAIWWFTMTFSWAMILLAGVKGLIDLASWLKPILDTHPLRDAAIRIVVSAMVATGITVHMYHVEKRK